MPEVSAETITVAEEIRRYLASHPRAADSMQGVLRWWLMRQRIESEQQNVQEALDYLARAGQVTKRYAPDGTIIYAATKKSQ